jgi:hypothetical protein
MAKTRKYQCPDFLSSILSQTSYEKWLQGTAGAHVKRDRGRGNTTATKEAYKIAIHQAVLNSAGQDHSLANFLDGSLVGQYRDVEFKANGRRYNATLALLLHRTQRTQRSKRPPFE